MNAVVLGGTGAVGRELVGRLVTSGNWSSVTTIGELYTQPSTTYIAFVPAPRQHLRMIIIVAIP